MELYPPLLDEHGEGKVSGSDWVNACLRRCKGPERWQKEGMGGVASSDQRKGCGKGWGVNLISTPKICLLKQRGGASMTSVQAYD